jgi:hypothetical protein
MMSTRSLGNIASDFGGRNLFQDLQKPNGMTILCAQCIQFFCRTQTN